jgi:hypothetical protein
MSTPLAFAFGAGLLAAPPKGEPPSDASPRATGSGVQERDVGERSLLCRRRSRSGSRAERVKAGEKRDELAPLDHVDELAQSGASPQPPAR